MALAVLAPVLVWLVADPLLGHRLRIADGEQTLDIGAVPVAVVALLASLAGWLLGRPGAVRARVRAIWTGAAGAVLAVSFRRSSATAWTGTRASADAPGGGGGADPGLGRSTGPGADRCRQGVTAGTKYAANGAQREAALPKRCAAGDDRGSAHHDRDEERYLVGRAEAQQSGPSCQIAAMATAGMVRPMLAMSEP
ncbi:hypothetical protein SHIRM173S_00952 [Streptomyces hirsutus]